jgi:hypothetical protein
MTTLNRLQPERGCHELKELRTFGGRRNQTEERVLLRGVWEYESHGEALEAAHRIRQFGIRASVRRRFSGMVSVVMADDKLYERATEEVTRFNAQRRRSAE